LLVKHIHLCNQHSQILSKLADVFHLKLTVNFFFTFRLVSAYEDKFKYKMDKFYLSKVQNLEAAFGGGSLTFPNFMTHILQNFENKNCSMEHCRAVDVHWSPFNDMCAFCDVPFQAIAKLETFDEDIKYYQHRI
jgi:hypothetical protein